MKKASALISVIIAVVMLAAALGVGFSVKQFRVHRAEKVAQAVAKAEPKVKPSGEKAALPGGGGERSRSAELTDEQRAERQEGREQARDRWENMSEEERRQAMAERGNRFDAGTRGQGGGGRPGGTGMSEEERQAMRDRFENMSEEEREKAREEMRRSGGRRRGDRGAGPGASPDGGVRRRDEGAGTTEENPDNPPEN
jgi:hypothetical protein